MANRDPKLAPHTGPRYQEENRKWEERLIDFMTAIFNMRIVQRLNPNNTQDPQERQKSIRKPIQRAVPYATHSMIQLCRELVLERVLYFLTASCSSDIAEAYFGSLRSGTSANPTPLQLHFYARNFLASDHMRLSGSTSNPIYDRQACNYKLPHPQTGIFYNLYLVCIIDITKLFVSSIIYSNPTRVEY